MKILLILVVLQFIFVSSKSNQNPYGVLKVSVYYESLCPYSIKFITEQLYPAYKKIKSLLKIDFVPYGNANQSKINGEWEFDCQHGNQECWGNKAQACGLALDKSQDKKVEYINCLMKQDNPGTKRAVKCCADELGVTSRSITNCVKRGQGDQLLAKYGDRTSLVESIIDDYGVPLVIFNDIFDKKQATAALENFLDFSCILLTNGTQGCPTEYIEHTGC